MWRHGLKRYLLALPLLALLCSPFSWAVPSAKEAAALEALAQAQAALTKAEAALTEAQKALADSKGELTRQAETIAGLKAESETLRAEYGMRLKELEALRMQSSALESSLKAAKADAEAATWWAVGLGLVGLFLGIGGVAWW